MHDEHPDEHVVEYFWNDTFTIIAVLVAVAVLAVLGFLWYRRSYSGQSGKEDGKEDYSIGVDDNSGSSTRKSRQTRKTYENIQPSEVASVRQKIAIL